MTPVRAEAWAGSGSKTVKVAAKPEVENLAERQNEPQRKFNWPVRGKIDVRFQEPGGLTPDGILIAVASDPSVRAVDTGTVIYAGDELKAYGNLVIIRHVDGLVSAYGNLAQLQVKRGDQVASAQEIGSVVPPDLATGIADRLHFEIRRANKPVDPEPFLMPSSAAIVPERGADRSSGR